MYKLTDGEFVTDGSRAMIVRLYRGNGPEGKVFCEWEDPESKELCGDWIHRFNLSPYNKFHALS